MGRARRGRVGSVTPVPSLNRESTMPSVSARTVAFLLAFLEVFHVDDVMVNILRGRSLPGDLNRKPLLALAANIARRMRLIARLRAVSVSTLENRIANVDQTTVRTGAPMANTAALVITSRSQNDHKEKNCNDNDGHCQRSAHFWLAPILDSRSFFSSKLEIRKSQNKRQKASPSISIVFAAQLSST
jgi:hypothetical protein